MAGQPPGCSTIRITITAKTTPTTPPPPAARPVSEPTLSPEPIRAVACFRPGTTTARAMPTATSYNSNGSQTQASPNEATSWCVCGDVADINPKPKMITRIDAYE